MTEEVAGFRCLFYAYLLLLTCRDSILRLSIFPMFSGARYQILPLDLVFSLKAADKFSEVGRLWVLKEVGIKLFIKEMEILDFAFRFRHKTLGGGPVTFQCLNRPTEVSLILC